MPGRMVPSSRNLAHQCPPSFIQSPTSLSDPSLRESHIVWRRTFLPSSFLVCSFLALETVFIVTVFHGMHSSRVRGTACAFCSASHTRVWRRRFVGLAPWHGILFKPFCFFWHRREREIGCLFCWVILRRLTVTDACPKHREAALSNVVYSHLPLRYSSADEEHCSSPPATLAAACDMMRFRLKTSLESDETHAIAPPPGSHVHPSPFSPYAIAFKIERVEPQALPQHPRQAPSPRSTCARLLTSGRPGVGE